MSSDSSGGRYESTTVSTFKFYRKRVLYFHISDYAVNWEIYFEANR